MAIEVKEVRNIVPRSAEPGEYTRVAGERRIDKDIFELARRGL